VEQVRVRDRDDPHARQHSPLRAGRAAPLPAARGSAMVAAGRMHESRILVDLPSAETDRRMSPIEWLRSLFGAQLDLRSGREELTVGALWLIEGLVDAFAAAGVRDVVSFRVDKEVVYLDTAEDRDDLRLITRAAERAGVLDRKFREMHLVLAHRTQASAKAMVIDCTVKNDVLLGEAEMVIALSSLDPTRRELDALTERIANELTTVLTGARVTCAPA